MRPNDKVLFMFLGVWFVVIAIIAIYRIRKTKKIIGDGYEKLISEIRKSDGRMDTVLEDIHKYKPPHEKEKRPLTDAEKIVLLEEEIIRLRNRQSDGSQNG